MKKSLITLSILSLTSLTFTAQAQTVLTVSSWVPPTHGLSVAQKEWCDALTAKTSNRVRCNILPRAVTPAPGTFDAVKNGLVDVSFTVHGYTPGRFVLSQIAEFPFLGDRAEPLSVAFNRIASKNPEFTAEHQGVKVLGFFTHGPGIVFNTKKPITKVEDLSGLKFRVGGFAGKVLERMGVIPQNIPGGDIYPALEKGTIDSAEWVGPYDDEKLGFQKVAKFYYYPGFWEPGPSLSFYINLDAWNKLPKNYQSALEVAAAEVNITMTAEYDAKNPAALNRLIQSGAQLRIYPRDILDAAYKEAEKLYADESKNNPKFKKIFTSWNRFRNDQNNWFRVAENSMASYIPRSK